MKNANTDTAQFLPSAEEALNRIRRRQPRNQAPSDSQGAAARLNRSRNAMRSFRN